MPLIKGTSSVSDSRALSKALKQTKFPPHFSSRIENWNKIQRAVIVKWIEQRITTSLGFEDEIVASTAVNLFLPPEDNISVTTTTEIDPRKAQIDLCGFLGDEDAAKFACELWELLLDASKQPTGIPRKILDEKKKEIEAQKQQQRLIASFTERPPVVQTDIISKAPVNKKAVDVHVQRNNRNDNKQLRHNNETQQNYRRAENYDHRQSNNVARDNHNYSNHVARDNNNYRMDGAKSFNDYEYDSFGRRPPPRQQYSEVSTDYHRSHAYSPHAVDQGYSNNRMSDSRQSHSSLPNARDDKRFTSHRESIRHEAPEAKHRHSARRSRSRSRSRERKPNHDRRSSRRSRRSPSESSGSSSCSSRSR